MKTLVESAERYLIEEDNDSVEVLVNKIAELTDDNDHNGSVMVLAEFLKAQRSIKIMKAIKELHNLYGHMPSQLIELRSYELKELLKQVTQKYGEEIADKVKGAF